MLFFFFFCLFDLSFSFQRTISFRRYRYLHDDDILGRAEDYCQCIALKCFSISVFIC